MRPYLWALGSIWLTWFWLLVAASVYEDVSTDDVALLALYLTWFLGIPLGALLTVVSCVVIACVQCSAALERRRSGVRHP